MATMIDTRQVTFSYATEEAPQECFWEKLSPAAHEDYYVQTGMTKKEAIKAVATDRNVPKNEIYNEVMKKDR